MFTKELRSFDQIANSAQTTINVCTRGASVVSGQNFEDSEWNTIIRHDSCWKRRWSLDVCVGNI